MMCCECIFWAQSNEDIGECMRSFVETYACHCCKDGVIRDET